MQISLDKKKKLKKLLESLATQEEKDELRKIDSSKVIEIIESFKEDEAETEDNYNKLLQAFSKYASAAQKHHQSLIESFGNFTESMMKKLDETGTTISTSYEKNKPFNAAGVYKDVINQLAAVNKNIKEKPVPVWNWPQYASVSIRNKNFANVNPATDGIGIGDYDATSLTQASTTDTWKFFQNGLTGTLVATVVITYTDSTKATISTVVKT